ncbi:ABC transporter ATP-binding protein [Alloiococcus otitis]|uniref:ABC transporter ATP-binding protein n=1 Tax=Alloiococcus otitis TaxID=1652 RepID=UPI0023546D83|nr:ABC transporter ATP-binding protein [Alloiococcus otitis]
MVLKVKDLYKQYPKSERFALKNVSFTIDDGEIVGLVGRNGSGKTTLLKILIKALRPTKGEIIYKGQSLWSRSNQLKNLGALIRPVFYDHLTVLENLHFYLTIHQSEKFKNNIESILKLVDLWDNRKDKPSTFSFGMKQRLSLAMSLLTEPTFLVLDEPFVGLDPDGVKKLIKILNEARLEHQATMIISSHQLNELESICQRYLFIENGQLNELASEKSGSYDILLAEEIQLRNFFDTHVLNFLTYKTEKNLLSINQSINQEDLNNILFSLAQKQLIKSFALNSRLDKYFEGDDHN